MLRIAVAAAFFAVFVSQADAAPNAQYKEVVKALDGIPSAVGVSVHKRLDKCGITVVKDTSWIETRAVDWPEYGAKAGESVLLIMMKMPVAKDQPPTNGVADFARGMGDLARQAHAAERLGHSNPEPDGATGLYRLAELLREYAAFLYGDHRKGEGRVRRVFSGPPGCTSFGRSVEEAAANAYTAAQAHVALSQEYGDTIPEARATDAIPAERGVKEKARLLIPVEIGEEPVRVNISLPGAALEALDRTAKELSLSRSGAIASFGDEPRSADTYYTEASDKIESEHLS